MCAADLYRQIGTVCTYRFEVTGRISTHRLPGWLCMEGEIAWEAMCRRNNKRLSEKSSHCVTVNCQCWYDARALVLPADKAVTVSSGELLPLYTGVKWGERRLWLQQHPLDEELIVALSHNRELIICYAFSPIVSKRYKPPWIYWHSLESDSSPTHYRPECIHITLTESNGADLTYTHLSVCITSARIW